MLKRKRFIFVGLIIIVAAGYLGFVGFQSAATYYYTVSELTGQESPAYGQTIRVNGWVAPGSVEQEPGSLTLRFTISEGNQSLPVIHQGVVPDAFKVGNEVVVEGYIDQNGILQSNNIIAKCASKYVPER
ncbi:MAG: cytochrome c maturation protein CcmE [Chloroflexi bacterium]|nr:cytochrome c maturation protein CcmE [Chloroflexota bacterium]